MGVTNFSTWRGSISMPPHSKAGVSTCGVDIVDIVICQLVVTRATSEKIVGLARKMSSVDKVSSF